MPERNDQGIDQHLDVETAVLCVVREVLDSPDVQASDNFFTIGGHSLLVIRVIAELREKYLLKVSARQFVKNATISAIAEACQPIE